MAAATALATLLTRRNPNEAYEFLKVARATDTAAQLQPWSGVQLQSIEAEIGDQLGDWAAALAGSESVLDQLAQAADAGLQPRGVNPHSLRGTALTIAAHAARELGQNERADRYRSRLTGHDQSSGQWATSETQFNAIHELIRDGQLDDAQGQLLAALRVFAAPGDVGKRGLVLIELALVEHRLGHHIDAIDLGRWALRASYAADERLDAAAAHARMANFLAAGPQQSRAEAAVHILAAAVIHMRVSQLLLAITPQPPVLRALARLTHCLARQPQLVPQSFEELRQKLEESTRVDLSGLLTGLDRVPLSVDPASGKVMFTSLPPGSDPPPGDSVTDALNWAMHQPPPLELTNIDAPSYPYHWQPIVEAVTDAVDNTTARARFREVLDDYRGMGWGGLADALEALITDRSAFQMPSNLQEAERDVIHRILAARPDL